MTAEIDNSPFIDGSKRRKVFLASILAVTFFFAVPDVLACTCMAFPEDEAKAAPMAYNMADVVFLGVVTNMKSKHFRPLPVRDMTFEVLVAWKGRSVGDQVIVRSAIAETACGYKFRKQGTYLVFAHWVNEHDMLWTNMCELNREESEAQGLIKELDKLKPR